MIQATVPQLTLGSTADFNQVKKYETDSDNSNNDVDIESEELVIGKAIVTRSGRQVKFGTRSLRRPNLDECLVIANTKEHYLVRAVPVSRPLLL